MKIGLGALALVSMVAMMGCSAAADEASQLVDGDSLQGNVSALGETISLNCAKALPGFPQPPCLPELVHTNLLTQVIQPGGQLAPGNYIYFYFKNQSSKPTAPFTVSVRDQKGVILDTQSYAGLAAGATASIVTHAPLECGWSRTVRLDSGNTVAEFDETNNERTQSYACPRATTTSGTIFLP